MALTYKCHHEREYSTLSTTMLACDDSSPYPQHINHFRFPTTHHSLFSPDNRLAMESQRRERIEFLKQREWTRRVAEWVKQTNAQRPDCVRPYRISSSARSYHPPVHPRPLMASIPSARAGRELCLWHALHRSTTDGARRTLHHLQLVPLSAISLAPLG